MISNGIKQISKYEKNNYGDIKVPEDKNQTTDHATSVEMNGTMVLNGENSDNHVDALNEKDKDKFDENSQFEGMEYDEVIEEEEKYDNNISYRVKPGYRIELIKGMLVRFRAANFISTDSGIFQKIIICVVANIFNL